MKPSKSNKKKRGEKKKRKPSSPSPPQNQLAAIASSSPAAIEAEEGEEERRALDLDWLSGAFTSLSLDQIISACEEAGWDAFKASGILGAQLVDPGEEEDSAASEIEEKLKEKHKKKKKGAEEERKQKKVAASSGMVANVIGKAYLKPSSNLNCGGEGKMGGSEKDRQYIIEEGEEFLYSMLGDDSELGMGVVRDVLVQCGYDVEKALDVMLDISTCSFNRFTERDDGDYSSPYPDIFSGSSADNDIESLQSTDSSDSASHPSEKENDILPYVGYGCRDGTRYFGSSEEHLPSRSRAVNPDIQQKVLESLFNIPQNQTHEPNIMNWKKVVQQVQSFGQGLQYHNGNSTESLLNARHGTFSPVRALGNEDEYQICRSVARKHWDTMKTHYQKAAMAYSRGQRAHAAQLSETGRIHAGLARKADEKASREIFEARNKDIQNTVTIDLHGQHAKQGIGLLKLHLLLFTYIPSIQFLKVITGCGGDGNGKGILKRSVISLAGREGIEWCEENSGTILLRLDGMKEYNFVEDDKESDED